MKSQFHGFMTFLLLFTFTTTVSAQIEWTGFFDILHGTNLSEGETLGFSYGQFEVDLSMGISENISAEAAVAYNADDGVMEMGAGFLDFHLFGEDEEHPARGGFVSHTGLIIGQFDVPFGIDYLAIPSPDRLLVTAPLLNEKTIDGWNNVGLNLYGGGDIINYSLYVVNGFEGGYAVGGRTGVTPIDGIEIGLNYAADMNDMDLMPNVLGLDVQAEFASIALKAEYQMADGIIDGGLDASSHAGYYIQMKNCFYDMLGIPFYAVARYGAWSDDGSEDANRITVGLGLKLNKACEMRAEFQTNQENDDNRSNQLLLQTVVSF